MMPKCVSRILLLFLAVAMAGCAGASVTQESQSLPDSTTRPSEVVIHPFKVNPSNVKLNQALFQRVYRHVSHENVAAERTKIADDTAQNICVRVAADLTKDGIEAACQPQSVQPSSSDALVVDGSFTNISEGNRIRRMVIGFGAGASVLDTKVQVYQRSDQVQREVMSFTTHADSGKMPGAGVTGPAGAAAGGAAAAASLGANMAAGGVRLSRSSTGFLADKTSAQIVKQITRYYAQQGWAPQS